MAVQEATLGAIAIPLETVRTANSVWSAATQLANIANITAISDLQVGAKCLETAVAGAVWNVQINLDGLTDSDRKDALTLEAAEALKVCRDGFTSVCQVVETRKQSSSSLVVTK